MLRQAQYEGLPPSLSTIGSNLTDAAVAVLTAAEPAEKVRLTQEATAAWRAEAIATLGRVQPPDRPARPARPDLLAPRDMPKRKGSGRRVALLHALAHIELNAIDLAWDLVARFADEEMPRAFFDDWVRVASEEAKHYGLLAKRMAELGAAYGDLPAHDGLWQAATETAHDLLARLAIVPLVLEARGLDVTPAMIADLARADDEASAAILQVIYDEEIGHVAIGRRWFETICAARGLDPQTSWQGLVRRHFKGMLKPPFNEAARDAAGFPSAFYAPLANR
ncbi:ferritin-like domain-containing protein [Virgifigura deserti]|uniref:ferritin-like domain-containing protein n=1 Tax=Virgifigura deserti TaxID=2268457 RepID=UPI003CCB830B